MKHVLNFKTNRSLFFLIAITLAVFYSCNSDDNNAVATAATVHIKTLPKVAYVLGEQLNLSDIVITIDKNGNTVDVPFSSFEAENIITQPANGTVLDFSHQQVTITVGESGQGLIQPISVTNNVVALEVKKKANENYVSGQKLDLTEMVVTLIKEDGSKDDVNFDDFGTEIETTPINGAVLSVENLEIKITYTSTKAQVAQDILVVPFAPLSGILATPPTISEYNIGERLDLKGTIVSFNMPDNQEVLVPFEEFEAFGLTTTPENDAKLRAINTEVLISHTNGVSVGIPIKINTLDVIMMDLESRPEKTLYQDGETIDLKGLSLKLSINGKEDLIITSDDFDIYEITTSPAQGDSYVNGTSEILVTYPNFPNTVSIPLGSEIIYESDFSDDVDGWEGNQNGGGSVNYYIEDGVLIVKDIVPGANTWDVLLFKPSITLEKDAKYKFTTIVKAYPDQGDFWFSLSVGDGTGRDGWQTYDGGGGIWLAGTEYQTYEKEFTMGQETTNGARILFNIGIQTNGIMVQYVKLEKL